MEVVSNKNVSLYLNQIMKVDDGEKFGGFPSDSFDYDQPGDDLDPYIPPAQGSRSRGTDRHDF
jgi:hypothetical protein